MNRSIKQIEQQNNFSLYDISRPEYKKFKTYIISTPETREVTTNPFLVGKNYRDALGKAITKTLSQKEIRKWYEDSQEEYLNVLHFLRGGLNFQILESLGELGKNKTRASFMTSERTQVGDEWKIQDDQYVKLTIQKDSIVFIGDIIATGSTLKSAMDKILKESKKIKHLIIITIGGEEAEELLTSVHKKCEENPNYTGTTMIYIEGIFHMANSQTKARIKINGTDLMPKTTTLAPEFNQTLLDSPIKALERCIIYDGGSRGFYPSHHYKDVLEYTDQVEKELDKGVSLFELIRDRWQDADKVPIEKQKKIHELGIKWVKQRREKINEIIT